LISATDTVQTGIKTLAGFNVGAAIVFSGLPANIPLATLFSFMVAAMDLSNNSVVTSYAGTLHFSSSDTAATLPADATLTGGSGVFTASMHTLGSQTLK